MKYTENIVHQVGFICKHYKYVYVKSPCILETCEHKFTENLSALFLLTITILPYIDRVMYDWITVFLPAVEKPPTILFRHQLGPIAQSNDGRLIVYPGTILHMECLWIRRFGTPKWVVSHDYR